MFRSAQSPLSMSRPVHVRQLTRNFSVSAPRDKQRLVILGSGWGGYEVMRKVDKKRWDVTMISPTKYFNFTPLLASCSVGTLEFRCAIEPVNRYSPDVRAYQAWCESIDFERKTLRCMPATPPLAFEKAPSAPVDRTITTYHGTGTTFGIRYDKLVIAVGAYSRTFNIPGVKEHAHFLKDVKDARRIRTRILECFEQANQPIVTDMDRRRLLNFCIVGGGPTGVEFAAELHDLLHTDMARHYPDLARMSKISLYDVAPKILGMFDQGLQEYAVKKFGRDGITILTSHHVERVESGKMQVKEQGEVHFGLLVWSTGLAPNPLVQSITEAKKDAKTGSFVTDDHLNLLRADGTVDPNVWAIGDVAQVNEGIILPATAQVASQKAKYLAKALNRIVKDKDVSEPFEFSNQGTLAYLGDWKAIYDRTQAVSGPKTKETGRLAWLLWRSAYFTMTVSVRNKILIPTFWFLNWIFGRDLTRF